MAGAPLAIFGCGPLGLEVAEQLRQRGWELILVDQDPELLKQAARREMSLTEMDYTDDKALEELILGTDLQVIFALFQDDPKNVFLTISARAIRPSLRIITVASTQDSARKLMAAGADKVIDPYQIIGHKVHTLIRQPLVAETMEHTVFGRHDLNLFQVEIPPGSRLAGAMLDDLDLRGSYNLVLLGVVDKERGDDLIFATKGVNHHLDAGDVMVVIGPMGEIERFSRDISKKGGSEDGRE